MMPSHEGQFSLRMHVDLEHLDRYTSIRAICVVQKPLHNIPPVRVPTISHVYAHTPHHPTLLCFVLTPPQISGFYVSASPPVHLVRFCYCKEDAKLIAAGERLAAYFSTAAPTLTQ